MQGMLGLDWRESGQKGMDKGGDKGGVGFCERAALFVERAALLGLSYRQTCSAPAHLTYNYQQRALVKVTHTHIAARAIAIEAPEEP